MAESDTTIIQKAGLSEDTPRGGESSILGISVRGLIAIMVVTTLCVHTLAIVITAIFQDQAVGSIQEPFYGIVYGVIGYYLGGQKTNTQPKEKT